MKIDEWRQAMGAKSGPPATAAARRDERVARLAVLTSLTIVVALAVGAPETGGAPALQAALRAW